MPRFRFVVVVAALAAVASSALAQGAFEPFPGNSAPRYQFDLARNFFKTPENANDSRTALIERMRRHADLPTHTGSAQELYSALRLVDSVERDLARFYAYYTLRMNIDRTDAEAPREMSDLAVTGNSFSGEFDRALATLDPQRFATFLRQEPRLAKYRYRIERARVALAHVPDAEERGRSAAIQGEATAWGPALFQSTMSSIDFGTVRTPEGPLDLRRNGNQIRNSPDRSVRETGFKQNNAALFTRADTFAAIITRTAAARNALARMRKWPDYPTEFYAAGGLTPLQVRALAEAILANGDVNKRYERRRIDEIKREQGYDSVHVWDLTAPPRGRAAPRFTIQQASQEVLAAARPLGDAYVSELAALLDPSNGRLDLVPRADRPDRPGFSTGLVGYPSMFFQGRYEGYVEDLVILSHEAGHAVQNMLMDSAGVIPRYAYGPSYFTESFAVFSELLLQEHLYRTATDSVQRRFFRNKLLEDATDMFRMTYETLVELQVYDSVAAGRMLGPEQIEQLTQQVGARYSVWFGPLSERKLMWIQPTQFYTWPLYRVNYAIARLLALTYMDRLRRDPVSFARAYNAMLRNGYDDDPEILLQRMLKIDLRDAHVLAANAMHIIEEWENAR